MEASALVGHDKKGHISSFPTSVETLQLPFSQRIRVLSPEPRVEYDDERTDLPPLNENNGQASVLESNGSCWGRMMRRLCKRGRATKRRQPG